MNKDKKTRKLVSFWDLTEEWRAEALRNHMSEEQAHEAIYFEPDDNHTPEKNVLWDLSDCMRVVDPEYDGLIGISNNSAMAVKLIDDETAETWLFG